jgi:uncharacterized protein
MRNAARLALVAALATTAILPVSSASAVYCQQPFTAVCQTLCSVGQLAGAQCLD